MIDQKSSPKCL